MFYSQNLLSRKGPLGTIWVAAHSLKRVKKHQVSETNISSSVEKILLDGVPVVSYRVLGFLLYGVVRIFSQKVEYLFEDCNQAMVEIRDFAGSKIFNRHFEVICPRYVSISRPERFELDAFDLQIMEDGNERNVRPNEEIVLADAWENDGTGHCSFDKEDDSHFESCYAAYTPVKDVFSPYMRENDVVATSSSLILSNSVASIEKLRGYSFSLEERLDPMSPGDEHQTDGDRINFPNPRSSVGKVEELPDYIRSFDEEQPTDAEQIMFPEMILPKSGKSQINTEDRPVSITVDVTPPSNCLVRPIDEEHQTDGDRINFPDPRNNVGKVEEPPEYIRSFDEEQLMDTEQIMFPEMISPKSGKSQIYTEDCSVSITIDVTPPSNCRNVSDATTPEFMVVRTPATKEHTRASRKRKCLFDSVLVFPNKVLKESIDDSSDLVCKRRKAPITALHAWKADQTSHICRTFLDPLIPYISPELRSLFCGKKVKNPEASVTVEAPATLDTLGTPTVLTVEAPASFFDTSGSPTVITMEAPSKLDPSGSPTVLKSPDITDIAPSTPVTCSTSLRMHEIFETTNVDRVESASSSESRDKELYLSEDKDLDISLLNEETSMGEEDNLEKNGWSARTRTVARFLYNIFVRQEKEREDEVVNVSQILLEKTRSKSARLFYEILVLKSGGYVEVEQQAPYDDIVVLETVKLKQTL